MIATMIMEWKLCDIRFSCNGFKSSNIYLNYIHCEDHFHSLPKFLKYAVSFFAVCRALSLNFAANDALDCGETDTMMSFLSSSARDYNIIHKLLYTLYIYMLKELNKCNIVKYGILTFIGNPSHTSDI